MADPVGTLGRRLGEACVYVGFTLREVAKALGCTPDALSDLEWDRATPDGPTLERLSRLYGVRVEVLRDGAAPVTDDELRASMVCQRPPFEQLSAHDREELRKAYAWLRDAPPPEVRRG